MNSHIKMPRIARSARKATRWCLTRNNPTQEEIEQLQARKQNFEFLICGLEHAPPTGTRTRQSTMEKLISNRGSFEPAMGPRENNAAYCRKEGNVLISFEQPKTLSRADIHYLQLLEVTKSKTRLEIATEFAKDYVLHHSTVEKLITLNIKTRGPLIRNSQIISFLTIFYACQFFWNFLFPLLDRSLVRRRVCKVL
jgi:hypothetical protein